MPIIVMAVRGEIQSLAADDFIYRSKSGCSCIRSGSLNGKANAVGGTRGLALLTYIVVRDFILHSQPIEPSLSEVVEKIARTMYRGPGQVPFKFIRVLTHLCFNLDSPKR